MTLNEVSANAGLFRQTPIVVVAAAMVDADGRVLMQRRPERKNHGGLWEFPGGKVEAGEAPVDALVRELAEELGVEVDARDAEPLAFAADAGVVLLLYRVTRWHGTPQALDAAALTWERPHALARLPMPPLDVPLAAALADAAARATGA